MRAQRRKVFVGIVAAMLAVTAMGAPPAHAGARGLPTAQAKRVARDRAWNFDARVENVKVGWYNRWGAYEVHVGVTGSWTRDTYHSGCAYGYYEGCSADGWTETADSECDATVIVKKSRSTGHVRSRVTDRSCLYG
jgi:hypothetical protein